MPLADERLVFEEVGGVVAVEAEHFFKQTADDVRQWHLTTEKTTPDVQPDGDPNHASTASGGAYLEALPDTRRSHGDKLVKGENYFPDPGVAGVLSYKVRFNTPGRYYVWARIFSTNTEDNGLHVGIDGQWPASGQRMQWTKKQEWAWDSKQRTEKNHGGEKHKLYLDIGQPGEHTIHFSLREDGTEFDKWMMTTEKLEQVDGAGPAPRVISGSLPPPFPVSGITETAPAKAAPKAAVADAKGRIPATAFTAEQGFYPDQGKWLAVNPAKNKGGVASIVFPYRDGTYDVTLEMVGENDGQSTYEVMVEQTVLGAAVCPPSTKKFEEGPSFTTTWKNVRIGDGDIVRVKAAIASADGKEWSRARWAALRFEAADGGAALEAAAAPVAVAAALPALHGKRLPDGDGKVDVTGELKRWHNVVLTLDGPFAHELDNQPNPFTDRRMGVRFTHESGEPEYLVPGYFAADGNAAETSAEAGTKWRAHLSPDKTGTWRYALRFPGTKFDGISGSFTIAETDKSGIDLRGKGRLQSTGTRYLRFAGNGEWFLKAGADAPETLLGYADFDNTVANKGAKVPLKTWAPHVPDWSEGDPTWKNGQGKGLVGAVNYLASAGCNVFSFLTYSAGGDGDNVWPHVSRSDKLHFDCSKLDQWGIVFSHGTAKGMYLHFKLQETENDDLEGPGADQALDGGNCGIQRQAYLRELIARFGHNLALNWNIGEENTQSTEQIAAMVRFIRETDPYGHNVVLHTFPNQHDKQYGPLLGKKDLLTGLSIQNSDVATSHRDILTWVVRSTESGHPWVVALDEPGNAGAGSPPDPDWPGMAEALKRIEQGKKKIKVPTVDEIRAQVLWGTLLAGGTGVEYYFGYSLPENDLVAENWRSRAQTWNYSRIALGFLRENGIPFWEMDNANALIANAQNTNDGYCFAKPGNCYVIYLPQVEKPELDLSGSQKSFEVRWFNPRAGGQLQQGSVAKVKGGGTVSLGQPPADPNLDWVVLVK